jgi:hypothetical protein
MFQKRQRRIKIKEDWKAKVKRFHERTIAGEQEYGGLTPIEEEVDHPQETYDPQGKMTYEKFKKLVHDPNMSVENELQEPSIVHVYEKFLTGQYAWAPSDTTLNEDNLPANLIKGHEESFKPFLQSISEDAGLRLKADRLHNFVHQPDTEEYLQRYHHTAQMSNPELAHDGAGTTEVLDDWAEPYETRMNTVRFNNNVHRQMDFLGEGV